jgi:AcrR family transcriptional regulator
LYTGGVSARGGTRDRLLKVAKELFSARGYEHASTSAIARQAGTSESQLMKHFGSKAGLLEAIFADTWAKITAEAETAIREASSPRQKLAIASAIVVDTMERDPELKLLLLLEGRRIRREGQMIRLTHGFMSFVELLDKILDEMKTVGQIRPNLSTHAVRSAFMGMIEGMLRDRFLAERLGYPANFEREHVTELMAMMLSSWSAPVFIASTGVVQ